MDVASNRKYAPACWLFTPYCLRDLAKKYGPLMHLQPGEVSHIIVSSPETAKQVMKIHDISFADRPRLLAAKFYNFTDIMFAPYGDYWRQLRKICTLELLTVKRVQSFRSIREEELSNLIASISSNAGLPINFTKMLFSLTNDITARAIFGGRCKDREGFILVSEKIVELSAGFSLADVFPSIKLLEILSDMTSELEKQHRKAGKILDNIINEHRARTDKEGEEDDLVDVLLNLQEQGNLEVPLTTDNIKAVILPPGLAWPNPGLPELAIKLISTVLSWVSASPSLPPTRFAAPGGSGSSASL
ncbi:hypothetical protein LWI28_011568 [Acer negundo]|uniref:Uncharacterized protein n=1 Tax=Acer negundo TaxID=4023 RepID=A0AAD5NX58_ACENE|nr:hypothetical protein LWI28_011568 [Acer negundo]